METFDDDVFIGYFREDRVRRTRVPIIEEVRMTTALRKSILSKPGGKPVRWLWPIVLCLWLAGQLAIVESSWSAETALCRGRHRDM